MAAVVHADEGIFDPDPQHPWNRLDAALSTDEPVPNLEAVNWNEQFARWVFTGPRYERAVSALDTQAFGIRGASPWFEAVSSDKYLNLHALNWKKRRYEWGLLQGLWRRRGEAR